jgi:hypothetical protein
MRHPGDVTHALLAAAGALASPGHGGTLREITARACVGRAVAGYMVPSLASRGYLEVVGTREVPYRNRPVYEYGPGPSAPLTHMHSMPPQRADLIPARAVIVTYTNSGRERMPDQAPDTTPTTWNTFV